MAKTAKAAPSGNTGSGEQNLAFQAEVAKLLDIVVHSLYSNREIFLRELISNASDSCDKLRYTALTDGKLLEDGGGAFEIHIVADKDAKTLTISDNGVGMNHDELIANLGTIAKSGTAEFIKGLSGDKAKDVSQIGQFGVGFYSSFMVADKVDVFSRKAGETHGWMWSSDGRGTFSVSPQDDVARGARIVLHLKDDAVEFAESHRLKQIVRTYSDHIALPVILDPGPDALKKKAKDGEDKKGGEDKDETPQPETLNSASALWMRPKTEITADQYKEFYHHVGHAFDEPWHTLHYRAEGAVEFTALLFVPSQKPFDLFHPERKGHVKLYVNRVFISDQLEGLMPRYLRFVRGVVDSADLPLNVSRELLQDNPTLRKIQSGIVKRLLKDLKERAEKVDDYKTFWDSFGPVFKEGLYEDYERREELLELTRASSTNGDGLISLKDYAGRMKEGQDAIYYITGDNIAALKASPQIEGFVAKGVEVLLLTDPIDEFWVTSVGAYDKKPFRNVAEAGADLSGIKGGAEEPKDDTAGPAAEAAVKDLIEKLKTTLGEAVADVRTSARLTSSPVCLVADSGGMSLHLARMLKQHGEGAGLNTKKVLEINPKHDLVKRLMTASGDAFDDSAHLLLDQARIVEGEAVPDPAAFARRLSSVMAKGLG
ncbi:MAG: molecular chaperone HtpG [Rhodospirillaceae bacterium]|nr:MAG: molecular chaperone HtpG [Rhodospirillaceae bacterium]